MAAVHAAAPIWFNPWASHGGAVANWADPDEHDMDATKALLALPFDLARSQYASAVQAGLLQRSMLASRDFEHALGALERLTLGSFARSV
jgi:hypothetical protein